MKIAAKWLVAFVVVISMWKIAYDSGVQDGEHSLGYWQGWQDAMTQTDYGCKPFNGEETLLK